MTHPTFATVVDPHQAVLRGLARRLCRQGRLEPEDLVQDTLERALRHLPRLAEYSDERRQAWLCLTLQRRFLDQLRRQRTEAREGERLKAVEAPVLVREPRVWHEWERVSEEQLLEAITHLRPTLRAAFELHHQGLSYKAIAQRLGTTPGTVGSWLHQARRELRRGLRPLIEVPNQDMTPRTTNGSSCVI